MKKIIVVFFLVCSLLAVPAHAMVNHNPLRKLARGIVNIGLSWIELPRQMIKVKEESGDIAGFFFGMIKGLSCTVGRVALGAYETVTFVIPTYKPLVDPEFIIDNEDQEW